MEIERSLRIVNCGEEVEEGRVKVVKWIEEELKVEVRKGSGEGGKGGVGGVERGLGD